MKTALTAAIALVVGVLATISVLAISLVALSLDRPSPSPVPMGTTSSNIAKELAAKIAPVIVTNVTARKEDIVAAAGGFPARAAVRIGFPVGVREIPTLTEIGCDAALDRLGGMSLPQIAAAVATHNRSKGRPSHPSVVGSASQGVAAQ